MSVIQVVGQSMTYNALCEFSLTESVVWGLISKEKNYIKLIFTIRKQNICYSFYSISFGSIFSIMQTVL